MAKIAGDSIFSAYEEWRGRQRPVATFEDDDDRIIHPPIPLKIRSPHWWGWYLNMAPQVSCIVVHPDGRSELHTSGGLKAFTPGQYSLTFIDMREHTSSLPDVSATTSDAWHVRLTLEITWNVRDPWRIWKKPDPIRALYDQCYAAVVNFIQSNPYEQLIATPEQAPINEDRIAEAIMARLNTNRTLEGFRFLNVSILGRFGDPERTKIIKQAMNQQEENKRARELAEAKLATAAAEQKLTMQATIAQLEADKKTAEYGAQISQLMVPALEQLVLLEQLSKSQELKQDGIIKAWEIVSVTIGQIAAALGQIQSAPGLEPGVSDKATDALVQILKTLNNLVPSPALPPNTEVDENRILPAVSIDHLQKGS